MRTRVHRAWRLGAGGQRPSSSAVHWEEEETGGGTFGADLSPTPVRTSDSTNQP
jgi:hypothetical protein